MIKKQKRRKIRKKTTAALVTGYPTMTSFGVGTIVYYPPTSKPSLIQTALTIVKGWFR